MKPIMITPGAYEKIKIDLSIFIQLFSRSFKKIVDELIKLIGWVVIFTAFIFPIQELPYAELPDVIVLLVLIPIVAFFIFLSLIFGYWTAKYIFIDLKKAHSKILKVRE